MTSTARAATAPARDIAAPAWVPWAIVLLVGAPALVMTRADPDLWGHVRFGLDMIETHTLPSVDPYSFTQDVPWVNHEWLSELAMGAAYRVAGASGLSVLKGTLVGVMLAVVLQLYRRATPAAIGGAILLLAVGTGRQVMTLRPQLWTLIGVSVLCRLFIDLPRRWWLIAVPSLFLLWVNFHGGWIVGAGLLAVWTAFQLPRRGTPRGLVVAVAVLSAAATLVNPYGWGMWTFLAETVRPARPITEWQPLLTVPILGWVPWIAVVSGVLAIAATRPRPPLDRLAMIALLAYGAFRVERLSPLCVVAALVLMSPTIGRRWPGPERRFNPLSRAEARGLLTAVVVLACISAAAVVKVARCIVIDGPWIPDRVAGRALAATTTEGRIVTFFDWGEYAIWHLAPRLRVSIDGRRETVYSDAALARQDAIEAATPEGVAYLRQADPAYVWLPVKFTAVREWLRRHGYRIDVESPRSFVAVRADEPILRPVEGEASNCFPGP